MAAIRKDSERTWQPSSPSSQADDESEIGLGGVYNPKLEGRVWRKLDIFILPVVAMFYFLSFLDRSNISNARVAGLQTDLGMTNKQYSIALTVTYVPYIAAELPSNLLLKVVGPHLVLPTMLTLWGIMTTVQGAVKSYHALLACRFLLGLFEGGVFPGLVLYCSMFYPRKLLNTRVNGFFSTATMSGAFSGLLAFGIINMDGVGNRPGWAWVFILEGLFTVVFGVASYFLLPGEPGKARFFTEEERRYVEDRLREDKRITSGNVDDESVWSWTEVGKAFKSVHFWLLACPLFMSGTVLYGLAYFTPSIVQGLGYTAARAQLMSVPPFAAGFGYSVIAAYVSDRYRCRGFILISSSILCIIGWALFLSTSSTAHSLAQLGTPSPHTTPHKIQYASLFLTIPGVYTAAPTISTWVSNNSAPHIRRATSIALAFILTNSGGILATWLFGTISLPPAYRKGTIVMLIFSIIMGLGSAACLFWLWKENREKSKRRKIGRREEEKPGLGDKSAWFVYCL